VVRADGGATTLPPVSATASALAPVPTGTPTPVATTAAGPAGTVGASPTGTVVVDVTGKVRRPGIATLPLGSRVVDALEAAGGARPGVRLGTLNLARVLTDGEQVVVGVTAPAGVAASAAGAPAPGSGATTPMVNLNSATQAELEELPGVGPVTAQSILAFRTEHGAFTAVDELLEVSGIGDATLAKIAPYVTL
jgi:competence protein ComEA